MRESLFERLKREDNSFIKDFERIYNLTYDGYAGAEDYFRKAFKESVFKVYFEDFDTAIEEMIVCNNEIELYGNLSDKIYNIKNSFSDLTLDCFLDYLEFFKTLFINKNRDYNSNADQIKAIIDDRCEKMGYTFKYDEEKKYFRVMLKNPIAESLAINANDSIKNKIYSYLTIRTGDVDTKRETIKSLADDVEVICKKYKNITEYDKLKQFIQCARHTKDTPKKEFPFYYENEELWLDQIFEMIIGILSFTKTKEIVIKIKELEKGENHA